MKILIFGGTGAMGTPLAELLADQGNDVFVTSRKAREYSRENIHCIVGNAHDMGFVREVLKKYYDVLVDFMNYKFSELQERLEGVQPSDCYAAPCRGVRNYLREKMAAEI